MVMTQSAWQLAIDLVLGAGSIALLLKAHGHQNLQNVLFKVDTLDPFTYTAVAALLATVAATSCFFQALRATRVNPMEGLRTE
jgi:multisubunit Na+/H+ antiporter MnhB subunit